ncbi:MAG TPA: fructose-bisphosphatase class II [Candidatus Brocadiia bacterium]|nr:fructose-bisphosphatase class II [Candidatus Brocadiales bacterium]
MIKDGITYVKDSCFDSIGVDNPYIIEAFIPEEYNLKTSEKGLQLANRNELRHAVGIVGAMSLRYFSTNEEGFNIFRARDMAVWWLRHIYNSFNWWKAYVVNAEGERKDMPMLYIGEEFGSVTGHVDNEVDIVLSAFENDRCLVNPRSEGGVIFAVGYSEKKGLFNSPDMYGVKTIIGSKYKGAGVSVTHGITKNLRLMAEHTLKDRGKEIDLQNIRNEIEKMKVVVLDRPRHDKLIETIKGLGAKLILVKDDDLTPTLAVVRNEVDLIIGVGGVPEAILSAIIVEKLGGEMSLRILPADVAQDEKLLGRLNNWNSFRKNEVDILRNFKIVRPGMEKENEIPWSRVLSSKGLAKGKDIVFTASVIKKTPWIKFSDGKEVPGVEIEPETGEIKVHVVRIACNNLEIVPVIYRTTISKHLSRCRNRKKVDNIVNEEALIKLGKAYAEFGMFQRAKECLQKVRICKGLSRDLLQRCNSVYEYIEGLDNLANKPVQAPETVVNHFEKICHSDPEDKEDVRSGNMIKRFYEYLGDKNYHNQQYDEAILYYREALKHSPHELKLHRKVNSIQMRDIIEEYFNRIDSRYQELNYKEPEDWEIQKLGIALEVFYSSEGRSNLSCREPWLVFFRRTVLHGKKPSYKLAILTKLLRLYKKLNQASDDELSLFLNKEFEMSREEIDSILNYKSANKKFSSVGELYLLKELGLESLSKLLLPRVKIESQNELEDTDIPLSISFVEAMERRYKNILEDLKEGFKEEAQEHLYAVAEAYHYVGLGLYDIGDDEGAKVYYEKAIIKFREIIEKFVGITPINAQYRIGNLYEELALLFEKEQVDYCNKAINAYMRIVDEQELIKLFGDLRGLSSIRIKQATERAEYLRKELFKNNRVIVKEPTPICNNGKEVHTP